MTNPKCNIYHIEICHFIPFCFPFYPLPQYGKQQAAEIQAARVAKRRSSGQGIPWSRLGVRVQLLCASKVSWSGKSGVIFRSSNQPQSAIQILVTCLTLMSQVSDTDPMQLSDLVAVAIYTPPCKLKPNPNDSADGDWIKAVNNIHFRTPLMCNPTCLLPHRFPHHLRSLEVRQS